MRKKILSFSILISFVLLYCFFSVKAQVPWISETLANVTVRGYLDRIVVDDVPINFTLGPGLAPATSNNPKQREPEGIAFVNVSVEDPETSEYTNVRWNISINATDLTDEENHSIPVFNVKINVSCCDLGNCVNFSQLKNLSHQLQDLPCFNLSPEGNVLIYFYLDVPAGQPNATYFGDVWINAYSSEAFEGSNRRTWFGPNNLTVTVKKSMGIEWTLTPIEFGVLNPGTKGNATKDKGWPTNITITADTNVFVDLYINGTDLVGEKDRILVGNITYANTTLNDYEEKPGTSSYWHSLNHSRPSTSTHGDFANWGMIPNDTDVYSWWNISIPNVLGGEYYGNLTAKIVEAGKNPD